MIKYLYTHRYDKLIKKYYGFTNGCKKGKLIFKYESNTIYLLFIIHHRFTLQYTSNMLRFC